MSAVEVVDSPAVGLPIPEPGSPAVPFDHHTPTAADPASSEDPSGAVVPFASSDRGRRDAQARVVAAGALSDQEPVHAASPDDESAPDPTPFLELRLFAEVFADLQQNRIALGNRIGAAERTGYVLVDALIPLHEAAKQNEHQAGLAMRRCFRRVAPGLVAWGKEQPGIGEHLLARLIGVIGHPVWAYPHHWQGDGADRVLIADEPYQRKVSQLWSYCGHGDPARRRAKGMTADDAMGLGNPRAKMLVRLIAEATMKQVGSPAAAIAPSTPSEGSPLPDSTFDPTGQAADAALTPSAGGSPSAPSGHTALAPHSPHAAGAPSETDAATSRTTANGSSRRRSPYRDIYDSARVEYATREGWTPGHQHSAALRLVGKNILRDLWIAAHEDGAA